MEQNETNVMQVTNSKHFPFVLVTKNGKTCICAANAKVSDKEFDTIEEAEAYIDGKPYELIINVACYCMTLKDEKHEE